MASWEVECNNCNGCLLSESLPICLYASVSVSPQEPFATPLTNHGSGVNSTVPGIHYFQIKFMPTLILKRSLLPK